MSSLGPADLFSGFRCRQGRKVPFPDRNDSPRFDPVYLLAANDSLLRAETHFLPLQELG